MNNSLYRALVMHALYVTLSLLFKFVLMVRNIASFGGGFVLSIVAMMLVYYQLKRIQQGKEARTL
jgi:hypothetical protein